MNPYFFTAPFYFAFIWFRVQGSRGGFAAFFLEDAILVSQPSPRGEGFVSGTAALSQMPCFHFAQTKTALRGLALQSGFWFYYSTVTDFARFLGLSTSFPLLIEV